MTINLNLELVGNHMEFIPDQYKYIEGNNFDESLKAD